MLQSSEPGPSVAFTPVLRFAGRYALPFGIVGAAFLLVTRFGEPFHLHAYAFFLFSVMATAFLGGFGPALVATVLAVMATDYVDFLGSDVTELVIFVVMGLSISFLTRQRQRAEQQLERANAELRKVDQAKDQLIATVSHELRTPVTVILGWAAILRQESDDQLRLTAAEAIEQSARAQTRLIDDLLDMSRLILGKMHLEIAPAELLSVVRQAVEAIRPAAEAKSISVNVMLPRDPCIVEGDALRLQQICWNLLSNAVKFTAEGGRIDVRLTRDGRAAQISVSDTGEGIPKELLPRVFETFRQGSGATAKGGLGLGLAIVRQLVTMHGGTVEAHSDGAGKGSRFVVRLPLARISLTEPELTG